MHESVDAWLRDVVIKSGLMHRSVLEVGSLNVNGSPRGLFLGPYVGIDKVDGFGVNVVMDANDLDYGDDEFEVVLCIEMLEHDPYPARSFAEMYRVLRPLGALLVTTRGPGFPPHDYTGDYWRYTDQSLELLTKDAGFKVDTITADPQVSGWFMQAEKP